MRGRLVEYLPQKVVALFGSCGGHVVRSFIQPISGLVRMPFFPARKDDVERIDTNHLLLELRRIEARPHLIRAVGFSLWRILAGISAIIAACHTAI